MTDKITLSREQVEKCLRDALIIRFHTDSHVEALRAALSNQSAPADKGHGGPVAWANWKVGTKSYVPYRTEEAASRSVEYSELAATQLGPYQVVPLYATRPAPVAVALPGRLAIQSHWPEWKISGSEGWNACLDELARLNPTKQ